MPIKQGIWKIGAKSQSLMQIQLNVEQQLEIAVGDL